MTLQPVQLLIAGLSGVTFGGNDIYTDGTLTGTDLITGQGVSLLVTTGSVVIFDDATGREHAGVVIWPERTNKVETLPPAVEDEHNGGAANGLGDAPAATSAAFALKR